MSIVVFYLHNTAPEGHDPLWQPCSLAYTDQAMNKALADCQRLRSDARNRHVCISSELQAMVGVMGVAAVENGHTPDGAVYEWSKAGRAGAARRK